MRRNLGWQMMKVIALTFGRETCASSYFRVHQYRAELAARGIVLDCYPADGFADWGQLREAEVVILQKRLFGGSRLRKIRQHARGLVYDIDDAIWLPHSRRHHWFTRWRTGRRLRKTARAADLCLAANGLIRDKLASCGGRADVLPMALDAAEWPLGERNGGGPIRVGWAGSPANLSYLHAIQHELASVQEQFPDTELVVFSGERPVFDVPVEFTHVPYETGRESEVVRRFDIGLLPLPGDPFSAHKSPIKALQYMASGAAIIASSVGATCELVTDGATALTVDKQAGWREAMARLISDHEFRLRLRSAARDRFERHFALSRAADALAEALRSVRS